MPGVPQQIVSLMRPYKYASAPLALLHGVSHPLLFTFFFFFSLDISWNSSKIRNRVMVLSIAVLKLTEWLWYHILANPWNRAARRMRNCTRILQKSQSFKSRQAQSPPFPIISKCSLEGRESQTLVCDIPGALLRTESFFPYFMLVAFEGGSIFRASLLLLSCPVLWIVNFELQLRVMIFISFCGLRTKDMESVSRAVLPKFFLENLNPKAYEILSRTGSRVVFTSVPRVMVEGFLKEYLSVNAVVGTELKTSGNRFTGLICQSGLLLKHRAAKEYFGEKKPDIGLGSSSLHDHPFLSFCKVYFQMILNKQKMHHGITNATVLSRHLTHFM